MGVDEGGERHPHPQLAARGKKARAREVGRGLGTPGEDNGGESACYPPPLHAATAGGTLLGASVPAASCRPRQVPCEPAGGVKEDSLTSSPLRAVYSLSPPPARLSLQLNGPGWEHVVAGLCLRHYPSSAECDVNRGLRRCLHRRQEGLRSWCAESFYKKWTLDCVKVFLWFFVCLFFFASEMIMWF